MTLGCPEGMTLGCSESIPLGCPEGMTLGCSEGMTLGCSEGMTLGCPVVDETPETEIHTDLRTITADEEDEHSTTSMSYIEGLLST